MNRIGEVYNSSPPPPSHEDMQSGSCLYKYVHETDTNNFRLKNISFGREHAKNLTLINPAGSADKHLSVDEAHMNC